MDKRRCRWAENVEDIYVKYHDEEWGIPVYEDDKLFEMLLLESFQAGLSWITILKKRENFIEAFDYFDVHKIALYKEDKINELLNNKGIIRNRLKIHAAIKNASVFLEIQKEYGSFSDYIWGFTNRKIEYGCYKTHNELSDKISNDMKKRGMKFVGTTIIYSYLQAIGMINDHEEQCFKHHGKNLCNVK